MFGVVNEAAETWRERYLDWEFHPPLCGSDYSRREGPTCIAGNFAAKRHSTGVRLERCRYN